MRLGHFRRYSTLLEPRQDVPSSVPSDLVTDPHVRDAGALELSAREAEPVTALVGRQDRVRVRRRARPRVRNRRMLNSALRLHGIVSTSSRGLRSRAGARRRWS